MRRLDLDDKVLSHLWESSQELGISPNDILRRVLNVVPVADDPRFRPYIDGRPVALIGLLDRLDRRLRAYNPGLHYVFRAAYVGYRRPDRVVPGHGAERSQIFVSVRVLSDRLAVVQPLDPLRYCRDNPGARNLAGIGHHGVGDLEFHISDDTDLAEYLSIFAGWLRPDWHAVG